MNTLFEIYKIKAELDISSTSEPAFSELGAGIENISEALNEVVYSGYWLNDGGFGRSEVTGMQPVVTITGKRVIGDPVQEYIFARGVKYGMGEARKTTFRITKAEGENVITITCPVTISSIQELSGNAQDGSAISFELRFNGKPVIATVNN